MIGLVYRLQVANMLVAFAHLLSVKLDVLTMILLVKVLVASVMLVWSAQVFNFFYQILDKFSKLTSYK